MSTFDFESREADIDSQLGTSKSLSTSYNSLVPSDMDAKRFWCRFYFHLNELEEEEKIRQSLFNGVGGGREEEEGDDVAAWDDMGDLDADLDVDLDMVELAEDKEEMTDVIASTTSRSSSVNTDDKKATTIITDGKAAETPAATGDAIVTVDAEGGAEEDAAWETVEDLEDGDGWAEIDEWS